MSAPARSSSVEEVANAVLYEGYLLYPYRHTAVKNRQRFNFGLVYPRAFSDVEGPDNPWFMETQCLVVSDGLPPHVDLTVRFLAPIERIDSAGAVTHKLSTQEAVEREMKVPGMELGQLEHTPSDLSFFWKETEETEQGVTRRHPRLKASIRVRVADRDGAEWRLSVRVENHSPFEFVGGGDRDAVLVRTFASTHMILKATEGRFVSLTDPPEHLRAMAAACENRGVWPVLAGDETREDTLLAAPIILYDYPQIAPESPGDLFDGTEIDEILTLRILTLTDEEKAEVRRGDGRAKELLERTEQLGPEHLMRLHGVLRPVDGNGGGRI